MIFSHFSEGFNRFTRKSLSQFHTNHIGGKEFMFILLLNYIKPLEEVDKELENHVKYLEKYYSVRL